MKISVSLPDEDVKFLDGYSDNRSAAVHAAVEALRLSRLTQDYAEAFAEFEDAGEAAAWESTAADGVSS